MKIPVKSEGDAFRIAVGVAALAAAAILVGVLVAPLYAYIVFGVAAAGALAYVLAAEEPERAHPLREAAEAPHPSAPKARHRVLVVANEALAGRQLRDEIMRRVELWPELLVVAPALSSRSHYWASDLDRELAQARGRLDATLAWAAAQGLEAHGEVGDPNPLVATEDALRRFGADEVIVATHPPEHENWLESGLLERIRDELDLPVTHVVVDLETDRVEIER